MPAALVTGASGQVGSQIVEQLARAGWSVRGLSRSESSDNTIAALGADPLRGILRHTDHVLLPQMTARDAINAFERFEVEALPVVDSAERRQVMGLLSESHTLRRYSDASERQRRSLLGEP